MNKETSPSNEPLDEDFQAWEEELSIEKSSTGFHASREPLDDHFRRREQELKTPDAFSSKPADIGSDDFEFVKTRGHTRKIGRSVLTRVINLKNKASTALRNEANATLNGYIAARKAKNERIARRQANKSRTAKS